MPVQAAQWSLQPIITSATKYSDNPRLSTRVREDTINTSLTSRIDAIARTERSEIKGKFDFNLQRYPFADSLNNDNGGLELGIHRKNLYDQWDVTGAYRNDSTLISELQDTGYVRASKRRNLWQLSPSWKWAFSENNSLQLGYQFQDVSYGAKVAGLNDYNNHMLTGGVTHNWDERTQLSTTLYGSRYKSVDSRAEYEDRGVQFGISRTVSSLWSANLVVGAHQLNSLLTRRVFGLFDVTRRDEDIGGLINASIERRGERVNYSFSLSRGVEPSGSGYATQRDRLSLTVTQNYSQYLNFSLTTSAIRNEVLQENVNGINRQYYNIQPRLTWNITKDWSLATNYSFAYQRREGSSRAAVENTLAISLSYAWPKIVSTP